jgi:hypothetical protein
MMTADIYAVTEEELGHYAQFRDYVFKQFVRPLPPILWYYTSASTFADILQSMSVWSTQISCLNDHTEFPYAVRLLRDEFKAFSTMKMSISAGLQSTCTRRSLMTALTIRGFSYYA